MGAAGYGFCRDDDWAYAIRPYVIRALDGGRFRLEARLASRNGVGRARHAVPLGERSVPNWIPAFAGMTDTLLWRSCDSDGGRSLPLVIPVKTGIQPGRKGVLHTPSAFLRYHAPYQSGGGAAILAFVRSPHHFSSSRRKPGSRGK